MVGVEFVVVVGVAVVEAGPGFIVAVLEGGYNLMICEKPWIRNPTVTRKQVWLSDEARLGGTPMSCGRCLPCRINKARVWKYRILLESLTSPESAWVTLTYSDENLPEDGSVSPKVLCDFIKRLRYHVGRPGLRYYGVGEYGDKNGRPHYHVVLFGLSVKDSAAVDKAWGFGFTYTGDLTAQSAGYTVGYVTKGWTFKENKKLNGRYPEFARMSRMKPGGIGVEAAKMIAEKIKDKGLTRNVSTVRIGGKMVPIGKYLAGVISKLAGIKDQKVAFNEFQDECFELLVGEEVYRDGIEELFEGKVSRAKNRFKFFKGGRKL